MSQTKTQRIAEIMSLLSSCMKHSGNYDQKKRLGVIAIKVDELASLAGIAPATSRKSRLEKINSVGAIARSVGAIRFLEDRLRAHEGGAPAVRIQYDDATFCYIILQKEDGGWESKTLGCSSSLARAFELAISGERYDAET